MTRVLVVVVANLGVRSDFWSDGVLYLALAAASRTGLLFTRENTSRPVCLAGTLAESVVLWR